MNEKSQFDELLKWLNADRDQAALAYENIRSRLIGIFARKGAEFPEELADETIQRVTKRVAEIGPNYEGDPAYYFVGVARLVFLESVNKKSTPMAPVEPPAVDQVEREHQCLQSCLKQIPDPRQRIILVLLSGTQREEDRESGETGGETGDRLERIETSRAPDPKWIAAIRQQMSGISRYNVTGFCRDRH